MVSPYILSDLVLDNRERCAKIKSILRALIFDDATIKRIAKVFESEMNLALDEQPSSLQMENTYIPELPDGTEEGLYLALDLGGTNFRVILLELSHAEIIREEVKKYHIDDDLRIGDGDRLFDFIACCVDDFVREKVLTKNTIPMGFTFSFPMKQHNLRSGCLVTWTKSFNCPSVVNQDVVQKLQESLNKINRSNIEVLAILNDTTGTLLQGAKLDKNTRIGIVLGTGTNAAYLEHADRVKHWETKRHGEKNVVIDIEWGAFGDNGVLDFIKTEFDREVDQGSLLVNSFTFEKYISGKYLGEICRVILKRLIQEKLLFVGTDPDKFPKPWKFASDNVSVIEQDHLDKTLDGIKSVLQEFNYVYCQDYNDNDIKVIQYVAGVISKRAANLISVCTSVLLNRMDETDVTIAIDGSVYKHHSRLRNWYQELTSELAPNKRNKFILAEDGSGKGAAIVAAIARKIQNRIYDN